MDDRRRELKQASLFIKDGFIQAIGAAEDLPQTADEVLDLTGHIVFPGFVNTHHHFYQTLTRAVPKAQDANLFNWLVTLYPIWARMRPEDIRTSTQTALAELALSGCTTASDHLYLFPNGSKLDDEIQAAAEVGLRLHASRGSMSLGESQGGLPPDSVVDTEDAILADSQRLIETYHDPHQSAILAREYGVHLHTHLAETEDEEDFCIEKFGHRPVAYMQEVDWIGHDVWFAHSVYVNKEEIKLYADTGCGVAHCPASNMRLASGIAPIVEMLTMGVNVGLGVDGSASNDGSHLLGEARLAMLLSRVGAGVRGASRSGEEAPPLMSARQALEIATRGGAAVLGRTDIGSLEVGKCADLFAINLHRLDYAGALHDPVAAALFCAPQKVDLSMVGGKLVVKDGELVGLDVPALVSKHNQAAARLLNG
jgi:cytosine/adenosine deaminase-related metal-dependent hydrolase